MKIKTSKLTFSMFAAVSMAVATSIYAQTTWTNADASSDITVVGNWSSGLPSAINAGTYNGATVGNGQLMSANPTLTNWNLNLVGGTLEVTGFNARTISGGSFSLNGGSIISDQSNNGLFIRSGALVTINNASSSLAHTTANQGLTIQNAGTSVVLNQGSISTVGTGGLGVVSDSNLTVNGGSVSIGGNLTVSNNFGGGTVILNGGSFNATNMSFGSSTSGRLTLGGSTAGSATFSGFDGTDTSRRINWLENSLMTLTIGTAGWAETEWTANRMFFNGDSSANLGNLSWADATDSSIGLGGGYYFDWNSGTNTLALAIPEPSSSSLLALGIIALAGYRRRISA